MTAQYCQFCQSAGIIATVNGPTCTHHKHGSDADWFPAWWDEKPLGMGFAMEIRRSKFLTELAKLPPPAMLMIDIDFD